MGGSSPLLRFCVLVRCLLRVEAGWPTAAAQQHAVFAKRLCAVVGKGTAGARLALDLACVFGSEPPLSFLLSPVKRRLRTIVWKPVAFRVRCYVDRWVRCTHVSRTTKQHTPWRGALSPPRRLEYR